MVQRIILWFIQGIIVGFGAIMPGVSGGTLCVAFGMYVPIIQTISHPRTNLRRYFWRLSVFVLGAAVGFVGLSGLAGWLLGKNSTLVTCAFVGFILGTWPEIWEEAGTEGRGKKAFLCLGAGFLGMLLLLTFLQKSNIAAVPPNFWGFLFCGVLWGISFIVPGLSSSTLLLFFGLYQPMLDGIASLRPIVIFPVFIGALICLASLSKGVNALYKKYYTIVSHFIVGVVIATTIMVIPVQNSGSADTIWRIICIAGAAICSYSFTRICAKIKQEP